jgi:hypothetical protein
MNSIVSYTADCHILVACPSIVRPHRVDDSRPCLGLQPGRAAPRFGVLVLGEYPSTCYLKGIVQWRGLPLLAEETVLELALDVV